MTGPLESVTRGTGRGGRARIVVGVDGSKGSCAALVQAFLAASRRGADLDVVAGYSLALYWFGGAPLDVPDVAAVRDDTHSRARALVQEVQDEVAVSAVPGIRDVAVQLFVSQGPAAHVLLERARGAQLLVVGNRGRGAVRSALLGSVALHCVTHASCPVLVVHDETVGVSDPPRVVVGVDGSDGSRAALAAAVREAGSRGADLDALVSFEITDHWTDLASVVVPSVEQIQADLRRRTEQVVDDVLAQRAADEPTPVPHIRIVVSQGPAGEVLVRHGRDADLLVVGSRGHGAFRGLLLGSVALHCTMHAPCPVMVVHSHGTPAAGEEAGRGAAAVG